MRVGRGVPAWGSVVALFALAIAAALGSDLSAPSKHAMRDLPPGVLPRSSILAWHPPPGPGITVKAKLVTLASLAAIDPDLTQCAVEGCRAGELVWLVLQDGPPCSFLRSCPSDTVRTESASDWTMIVVDAASGIGRLDAEGGISANLSTSAWARLTDLAPQN